AGLEVARELVEELGERERLAVVEVGRAERDAVERRHVEAALALRDAAVGLLLERVGAEGVAGGSGGEGAKGARDLRGRGGAGLLGLDLLGVRAPEDRPGRIRYEGRAREIGHGLRGRGVEAARDGPAGAAVALVAAGVVDAVAVLEDLRAEDDLVVI